MLTFVKEKLKTLLSVENKQNISVVMCTFNGARFLCEQLDSIFSQTLQPTEVIVQDDGSTDATWSILQDYATRYPQMQILRNEGPHGINSNFFSAIRRASCPLIALSDQDDIWESYKLERQVQALGENLLCSGLSVPFSDGNFPVSHDHRRPNFHILRLAYLGALPGHTFLMRREILAYLPQDFVCPYLYDWQFQMIAAAAERIAFVDDTLVRFRRHAAAATANIPVSNQVAKISAFHYVFTTLFHHARLQREVRQRFSQIRLFLNQLPFATQSLAQCQEMAALQLARGPIAFLQRVAFFVKHRDSLFYARENRRLIAFLRALYFPFSCGYYYRNVLKH